MATADSVKAKLQGLLDSANETTGNEDKDLTSAVAALIAGYGQGGENNVEGMYSGSFTPAEHLLNVEIAVGADTQNLLIFTVGTVTGNSVKATAMFYRNREFPFPARQWSDGSCGMCAAVLPPG